MKGYQSKGHLDKFIKESFGEFTPGKVSIKPPPDCSCAGEDDFPSESREYDPEDTFMVHIGGDSMMAYDRSDRDSIEPDDIVIFRFDEKPENGDVVFVEIRTMVGTVQTVRKFHRIEGYAALIPVNPAYRVFVYPDSCVRVIGVMTGLIRIREWRGRG